MNNKVNDGIAGVAKETLTGDMRDYMLDFVRQMPKPWSQMTEREQQTIIDVASNAARTMAGKAVNIIARDGRETVMAEIEKIIVDKGLKITMSAGVGAINDLVNAKGKTVLIVTSGVDDFEGEKAPATPEPDQSEMFGQEYTDEDGEDMDDYPLNENSGEAKQLPAPDALDAEYEECAETDSDDVDEENSDITNDAA